MRAWTPIVVAALVVACIVCWRAGSGDLLGFAGAEVYGHAWVQWWHGEALPGWPAGTELAAGADPWPVIDPVTTGLGAVLGRLFGYTAGWNLTVFLAVVGAFLGGAFLAKREGGHPLVGGVVLALAPIFMGSLASGLTEDAALGLLAAALACLAAPGLVMAVVGGLLLGLLAWCGPYLAWMGGVCALGLGVHALVRDRTDWRRWLVAGVLALVIALPAALSQEDRSGQSGVTVEQSEPLWKLNPWRGADLGSLVTPGPQDPGDALIRIHPGYLGLIALGLAIYGGRSRWWFVLLASVLLAPGETLRAFGEPLGVANPFAWLLDQLPFGGSFHHHARFLLIGQVALAVLAARGAQRLGRGELMAGLIGLELLLLAPSPAPLPTARSEVARIWEEVEVGPVYPVPAAGPGVHFQAPLYAQRAHGEPLAITPNMPGYGGGGAWARWLMRPEGPPPDEPLVGSLVVRPEDVEHLRPLLVPRLGESDVELQSGAIWTD
ncbi:MAG: hypothetical protein GY913_11305 [Proteobacteria bacterium]|nr:hypothetical protein [Pseudomonadota bacterium]MCP4917501.1 hypothetical protein [Pseudomonadota bacterium]